MAETDLSDLIDSPRETLEIELKGWPDLGLGKVRDVFERSLMRRRS